MKALLFALGAFPRRATGEKHTRVKAELQETVEKLLAGSLRSSK